MEKVHYISRLFLLSGILQCPLRLLFKERYKNQENKKDESFSRLL